LFLEVSILRHSSKNCPTYFVPHHQNVFFQTLIFCSYLLENEKNFDFKSKTFFSEDIYNR
jgi:hypothetical protein